MVYIENRSEAYDEESFMCDRKTKVEDRKWEDVTVLPIIIQSIIDETTYIACTENRMIETQTPPLIVSSCPVLSIFNDQGGGTDNISKET